MARESLADDVMMSAPKFLFADRPSIAGWVAVGKEHHTLTEV